MFQKELMKIKQVHQKKVSFAVIGLDVGFKFEEHVSNRCHDLLTMAHSLKNIAILRAKGVTFRCTLVVISKNKALKRLNNSVTYDRGVLYI